MLNTLACHKIYFSGKQSNTTSVHITVVCNTYFTFQPLQKGTKPPTQRQRIVSCQRQVNNLDWEKLFSKLKVANQQLCACVTAHTTCFCNNPHLFNFRIPHPSDFYFYYSTSLRAQLGEVCYFARYSQSERAPSLKISQCKHKRNREVV